MRHGGTLPPAPVGPSRRRASGRRREGRPRFELVGLLVDAGVTFATTLFVIVLIASAMIGGFMGVIWVLSEPVP